MGCTPSADRLGPENSASLWSKMAVTLQPALRGPQTEENVLNEA